MTGATIRLLKGGVGYWLIFSILALRLFWFTDHYAVDLFFYDQWSYLTSSIYPHSLIEGFFTPIGPHRIGLGYLFFKSILVLGDYNNRWISMLVVVMMVANASLFSIIKTHLVGKLQLSDIYVPLIFFNLHQYAVIIKNPNISIHQLPFAFLMLLLLLFSRGMSPKKFLWLMPAVPLMSFTGNGFFVTIALLCFSVIMALKSGDLKKWWWGMSAIALISTLVYLATANYSAMDCGQSLTASAGYYFTFLSGMTLNGLLISQSASVLKVVMFVVLVIFGTWIACGRIINSKTEKSLAPLILLLYSLLFIAATTLGRWCYGLGITDSSRYIPHIGMGFLAFALWAKNNGTKYYRLYSLFLIGLFL